jgi:glutamine synthetase
VDEFPVSAHRSPADPAMSGRLSLDELRDGVADGTFDTVVLAIPDMQGRLQGKRLSARHFLDHVVRHGTECCDYLLAVDVDMNTVAGYPLSSWDRGYGDFRMVADPATIRRMAWHQGSALVLADLQTPAAQPVAVAPRHILKRQLDRLAEHGLTALVGTELEFILFRQTYEEAWDRGYRHLTPVNRYNIDYSLQGTATVEPFIHRLRNAMTASGLTVESSKGEANAGQYEIGFFREHALTTCDQHVIYKAAAKEMAAQDGLSLTFLAKYNAREGNSSHVHCSLRSRDDAPVMASGNELSRLGEHFVAGQLAALPELVLFHAPNINSYKRFADHSFAPTTVTWARDNRTCAFRLVGSGPSLRIESRIAGADVNPYLAVSALLAAGLYGIEHEVPLRPATVGDAYASDAPRLPRSLSEAAELWEKSSFARLAFGDDVVDHYATMARVELDAFATAITDWELYRGFERL